MRITRHQIHGPALLAAAGVLLAFALYLLPGNGTPDMAFHWLPWIRAMRTSGVVQAYAVVSQDNYPPLAALLLWAGNVVLQPFSISDAMTVKVLLFGFLCASSLCLWLLSRNGVIAVLFFAANVVGAAGLAYLDILLAPFMILALLMVCRQQYVWFALLITMAVLIKWQPVMMGPFIALFMLRMMLQQRAIPAAYWLAVIAVPMVFIAVIVVMYGMQPLSGSLDIALGTVDYSAGAMNINGLVSDVVDNIARLNVFKLYPGSGNEQTALALYKQLTSINHYEGDAISTLRFSLSRVVFYGIYLFTFYRACSASNSPENMLRYSILAYIAYFLFCTGVHENHLFMPQLLAWILVARQPRYAPLAILLTVIHNANLVYRYGFSGEGFASMNLLPGGVDAVILLDVIAVITLWCAWFFYQRVEQQN